MSIVIFTGALSRLRQVAYSILSEDGAAITTEDNMPIELE